MLKQALWSPAMRMDGVPASVYSFKGLSQTLPPNDHNQRNQVMDREPATAASRQLLLWSALLILSAVARAAAGNGPALGVCYYPEHWPQSFW